MAGASEAFRERYRQALIAYVCGGAEDAALSDACGVGKAALDEHHGLVDLLSIHQSALRHVTAGASSIAACNEIIEKAAGFLAQVVAPFEMAHRGWRDAVDRLRQANEALERQAAERNAALSESERRFQDIAAVSADWMWETDREHRFSRLFGARVETLPVRPEGLIGRTRWEAAGAQPDDEPWSRHKADLEAHRPFRRFRYEIRSPAGAAMFISASGKPVFDRDGNFIGYRGTATDETAAVEAERRAEAADALLRNAIESISGGFVITDAEDRLVLFNTQYRSYYPDCGATLRPGGPYEDFLRERIERGYYPNAKGREESWFAEVMARHLAGNSEVEIALPDGRWLLLSERRMSGGGIAGVCLDTSALKTAQQALADREAQLRRERDAAERSEEQFRRLFETSLDLIIVTDRRGIFVRVSPSAKSILGYDPDELVGRSGVDLVYHEDLDATRDQMRAARRDRTLQNFECRYVHKRGHPVSLWWTGVWSTGEQHHFFIGRDMTDRMESERRLRESEEQLKSAQRLAHMGSEVRNLRTDEAEWSDETCRIFGVSREEYAPSTANFLAMLHPDDRDKVMTNRELVAQGITPPPFEYRITRPDGSVRQIYRENEIIKDDDGRPLYLVGTIHDITERRQTEEQLRQVQKMEAIGNLTGGMAHDFNNLLSIIVGNLGLAVEEIGGETELGEMVGEALDAAWRGADLTRRLLAFARRQPLQPVRLDLNELIADTARLLRRLLGEDIEVRLDLATAVWPIVADPAQLEASLANLATNARDAMPRGGSLIIATANRTFDADYVAEHAEAAEGDFAMLEITDTGFGMTPEVIDRIFEPFFTTKEQGKGTGLGLSMVFGFLHQSGGHVSVYSEPGAGTTFRLYLPRAATDARAADVHQAAAPERGGGEVVLVVEDNPGVRRIVLRQLGNLGYRALECERAAQALDVLQREPVDLLLTDIVMPGGLDGLELARLAQERWPSLKIVLTSGFPQARIDATGDVLGGAKLLSKPYTRQELAAVLHAALQR